MQPLIGCLLALGVSLSLTSPFGGWGPGEDYGNTGAQPPKANPNAVFGYDAFRLTNNRFNYRSGPKREGFILIFCAILYRSTFSCKFLAMLYQNGLLEMLAINWNKTKSRSILRGDRISRTGPWTRIAQEEGFGNRANKEKRLVSTTNIGLECSSGEAGGGRWQESGRVIIT